MKNINHDDHSFFDVVPAIFLMILFTMVCTTNCSGLIEQELEHGITVSGQYWHPIEQSDRFRL